MTDIVMPDYIDVVLRFRRAKLTRVQLDEIGFAYELVDKVDDGDDEPAPVIARSEVRFSKEHLPELLSEGVEVATQTVLALTIERIEEDVYESIREYLQLPEPLELTGAGEDAPRA